MRGYFDPKKFYPTHFLHVKSLTISVPLISTLKKFTPKGFYTSNDEST